MHLRLCFLFPPFFLPKPTHREQAKRDGINVPVSGGAGGAAGGSGLQQQQQQQQALSAEARQAQIDAEWEEVARKNREARYVARGVKMPPVSAPPFAFAL